MDTASITQLIELFKELGQDAQWAFFVWIFYGAFEVLMLSGTILTLAWWIIRAVVQAPSDEQTIRTIAEMVEQPYYERADIIGAIAIMKSKIRK